MVVQATDRTQMPVEQLVNSAEALHVLTNKAYLIWSVEQQQVNLSKKFAPHLCSFG